MSARKVIVNLIGLQDQFVSLSFSVENVDTLLNNAQVCLGNIGKCLSDVTQEDLLNVGGILEYIRTLNEGKEDEILVFRMRVG